MQNASSDQSLVTASSAGGKSGRLPFIPNLPTPPSTTTTTVVAKSQNPQQQQVVAHRDSSGGALTKRASLVHSSRFICEKCGCTGTTKKTALLFCFIFFVVFAYCLLLYLCQGMMIVCS